METFLLVDDTTIIDKCLSKSITSAQIEFSMRGWVTGNVISEADYMAELQLNALEDQSIEQ